MKNFSVDWASQVLLAGENLPAGAGDVRDAGSIPGSGRSPGDGNGSPLQCSCPGNPVDRGAWRAAVHGVARGWTRLQGWAALRVYNACIAELLGGIKYTRDRIWFIFKKLFSLTPLVVVDSPGKIRRRETSQEATAHSGA